MQNPLTLLYAASNTVLAQRCYRYWFIALVLLFIAAYILLPVWLVPGNTLFFQLGLFHPRDYLLFVLLSAAAALLILMQAFLVIRSRRISLEAVGQSGVGAFSALFAGLLATAACSSCIAALIGFLGAGSVFFVFDYHSYVVAGGIVLVLAGLYFSAFSVQRYCEGCKI